MPSVPPATSEARSVVRAGAARAERDAAARTRADGSPTRSAARGSRPRAGGCSTSRARSRTRTRRHRAPRRQAGERDRAAATGARCSSTSASRASTEEPALTRIGDFAGTPALHVARADRAATHGAVDRRTDVYSLGVDALRAAHAAPAVRGPTDARTCSRADREPASRRSCAGSIRLCRAISRRSASTALEKDPARRYPSMSEFAADLRALPRVPARARAAHRRACSAACASRGGGRRSRRRSCSRRDRCSSGSRPGCSSPTA